jgi:GNAT superfamily N-acetyltransferase
MSNLKLEFTLDNQKELAKRCLQENLYLDGGVMAVNYNEIITDSDTTFKVMGCFQQGELIASIVLNTATGHSIAVFVKEQYRRQGLGTRLISELIARTGVDRETLTAFEGVPGSLTFFDKCQVLNDVNGIGISKQAAEQLISGEKSIDQLYREMHASKFKTKS